MFDLYYANKWKYHKIEEYIKDMDFQKVKNIYQWLFIIVYSSGNFKSSPVLKNL